MVLLIEISALSSRLIFLYNTQFTNFSFSLSIAIHLRSALYPDYSTTGGILQRYLFAKGLQIDFFGAVWYNKDKWESDIAFSAKSEFRGVVAYEFKNDTFIQTKSG